MSQSRYKYFIENGTIDLVPFISIPLKNSDYYVYYEIGKTRLDLLSYQYYNDPNYDWLIMQANPQYGSLEFNIPDGVELRIPYPLDITINDYQKSIEEYYKYNESYGSK